MMKLTLSKPTDRILGSVFILLSIAFVWLSFANEAFFNWAFERHQNQLSWYIRPLFLIPFCYFAYRQSWAGATGSIFLLLTSMFWFPVPDTVSEQVTEFLAYEKAYLYGEWNPIKLLLALSVPISLFLLGLAFWKRSLWMGIGVVVLMAAGKTAWSLAFAGESGRAILVPAVLGLLLCCALIFYGFRRLERPV
jgi:hypothetical protein